MVRRNTLAALGSAALMLAAVAACAPADDSSPSASASASASGTACPPGGLDTKTAGKLTIGTDNPAYEPWYSDNKPDNGKGFESAVAYQVAERLGYPAQNVTWTQVPFNNAIAPGPKSYDIDLNQFSITPERKQAVDFSSPYYLVRQTVITTKGSKIDGRHDDRRPQGRQAGRPGRHHEPPGDQRADQAEPPRRRSSTATTTPRRPCRTAPSTVSWWTCRPRST